MPIIRRTGSPTTIGAAAAAVGDAAGRQTIEREVDQRRERELDATRSRLYNLQDRVDAELLRRVSGGAGGIDASGIIRHNIEQQDRRDAMFPGLAGLRRRGGRGSGATASSYRGGSDLVDETEAARLDEARAATGRRDYAALGDEARANREAEDVSAGRSIDNYRKAVTADLDIEQGQADLRRKKLEASGSYMDLQRKISQASREDDEAASRQNAIDALRLHAQKVGLPDAVLSAATSEMLGTGRYTAATLRAVGLMPPADAAGGVDPGKGLSVGAKDFLRVLQSGGFADPAAASALRQVDPETQQPGGAPTKDASEATAAWAAWLPNASAEQIESAMKDPGFSKASETVRTMVKTHHREAKRAEAIAQAPSDIGALEKVWSEQLKTIGKAGPVESIAALAKARANLRATNPRLIARIDAMLDDPELAPLLDELLRKMGVKIPVGGQVAYPDSPGKGP